VTTVTVLPITSVGSTLPTLPTLPTAKAAEGGTGFADKVTGALDELQQLQTTSDGLALQAMTGDLTDVHDYLIASNEAGIATQLTVAVRNKAVEAFQSIMNMQV
jgi:flagellar hook-basal body complex protein FliE